MFIRYASAVTTGTVMTFGLLFVMQALISLQPAVEMEARERHFLNPFELRHVDTAVRPADEIIPKEKLTETELPPTRPQHSANHEPVGYSRPAPTPPTGTTTPLNPGLYNEGPLVSLVRVEPVYPSRALARGTEGYATVQFDVTSEGHVANIVLIESTDSIFDDAAIKAAKKFRFKPRVVNGVPQSSYGIRNRFRFEIDK